MTVGLGPHACRGQLCVCVNERAFGFLSCTLYFYTFKCRGCTGPVQTERSLGTPNVQKCYGPGLPARTQPLRDAFVAVLPPAGFFGVCTEHPQNTTATHLSSEATPQGLSVSEQGAHAQCHPCQGCLRCGEILGRVPAKFPWRSPRTLKIPEPGHVTGRNCV